MQNVHTPEAKTLTSEKGDAAFARGATMRFLGDEPSLSPGNRRLENAQKLQKAVQRIQYFRFRVLHSPQQRHRFRGNLFSANVAVSNCQRIDFLHTSFRYCAGFTPLTERKAAANLLPLSQPCSVAISRMVLSVYSGI